MDDNRDAALTRATTVLRAALDKQAGLPTDEAVVELFLATRSIARLLNGAYNRVVAERERDQ